MLFRVGTLDIRIRAKFEKTPCHCLPLYCRVCSYILLLCHADWHCLWKQKMMASVSSRSVINCASNWQSSWYWKRVYYSARTCAWHARNIQVYNQYSTRNIRSSFRAVSVSVSFWSQISVNCKKHDTAGSRSIFVVIVNIRLIFVRLEIPARL